MVKCAPEWDVILKVGTEKLMNVADKVQRYYRAEYGQEYDDWMIVAAISRWLDVEMERTAEDLPALLTDPSRREAQSFRRQLEKMSAPPQPAEVAAATEVQTADAETADVFTGNRIFSFEKISAMVAYIALHARDVYKTKLNKLLFYADFTNFYLSGSSISGSRYVHLPHGPVPDGYEKTLQKLEAVGTIRIDRQQGFEVVKASHDPLTDTLSPGERASLDWVIQNYGRLSAREISELSHSEMAYRFTRTGEPIAYEYAKFFEHLP